jgi:hypothetical protein
MKIAKLFTTIGATAVAVSCCAGIKYWDSQDYKMYDADSYTPGAVWNYDGIRNQGIDQPHSTTTTTWKNLGSSGSNNDMWVRYQKSGGGWANSSAPSSLDPVDGKNLGSWTANGFTFTGDSEWRAAGSGSTARIESGTNYTIQVLVDGNLATQKYSKPYIMSVQNTHFCIYGDKANSRIYWGMSNTTADHLFIPISDDNRLGYMTAIANADENTVAFFSGTTIPTSGDGFRNFSVSAKNDNGYCLCGYTGNDGLFVGTINSYRYYKRVLTEDELAWNRVVDEYRFFGRNIPIPVTNVVVATAIAGADGAEPSGSYAVNGRHVFTAPATVNVGGMDYVCTGYTIETQAGDGWSTPVFHKAALYQPAAFVATDADCVRLTWQWAKAAGLANLYTVDDYAWEGLEVFYDGICNVGTNLAHSYSATTWVNIGSTGSVNNVFIQRLKADGSEWETATDLNPTSGRDPGCWTENGFTLKGESRFRCNAPGGFVVTNDYSLQMLVDVKASDQGTDRYAYLFGANNDEFALRIDNDDGNLYWRYKNNGQNQPSLSSDTYDYMTAIMKETNTQTLFTGTTEPTSGAGCKANTSYAYSATGFCLGGYGKLDRVHLLTGTIKSFRQYDHALSAAEVAKNRAVDNWRYFGIPDMTNVIVQSTVPYLRGDEPDGPYAVDVSHAFTAPEAVTVKINGKEISYACDGYIVEIWDGSTWTNATVQVGNSYTYTAGSSPDLVRLTWKWKATHGLRTAADYSFDDYSQAGLVWNYDGIRNQGGTDADHDSSATTWKNLGSGGSTFDLSFKSGTTTTGEWEDDGYVFRDGPRFWSGAHVGPVKSFTLQALVDASIANQPAHTRLQGQT